MSVRLQIPAWTFGIALMCGGLLHPVAAEPHQYYRGPEIVPAFSGQDHVRPVSRITDVRSLNAPAAPAVDPPAARDLIPELKFNSAIARELNLAGAAELVPDAAPQSPPAAPPAAPERFQRSPDISEPIQTAARPDAQDQPPITTADAVRQVPGEGPPPIASDVAPLPPPQVAASAPIPDPTPVQDAGDSDFASGLLLAGGVAGLALFIGLWIRLRQPGGRLAASHTELSAEPTSIRFERPAPVNPLEALIRNELMLIEERVEYPARLEFYGWPAGLPIARVDAAHAAAETGETPALAGPHFSKHAIHAGHRAGARKESTRPAGTPARQASTKIKVAAVHAAHDSEELPRRRPASPDSETAGPLERALERLARNQS